MKYLTHLKIVSVLSLVLFIVFIAAGTNAQAEIIVSFPLDTDPGWTVEGQWSYGVPLGGGSNCLDPSSGHTGTNVYEYNLAGDYLDNMPVYYLTSTAIDCSGYKNVELEFWRWLGIESSSYDHAKVEVSNNGTSWTTVWSHAGGNFCDGGWIECSYDISSIADDQATVYIRWAMGTTDYSVTYPGWNIDNISLHGDAITYFESGIVNFEDYAVVAGSWLDTCSEPNWCEGADIDHSGAVDYKDIEHIANNWLRTYYVLSASVLGGNGAVSPSSEIYPEGTVAGITATPDSGYRVKAWTGTDDDSSKSTNNTVTMNTSKSVTVEFEYNPFPTVTPPPDAPSWWNNGEGEYYAYGWWSSDIIGSGGEVSPPDNPSHWASNFLNNTDFTASIGIENETISVELDNEYHSDLYNQIYIYIDGTTENTELFGEDIVLDTDGGVFEGFWGWNIQYEGGLWDYVLEGEIHPQPEYVYLTLTMPGLTSVTNIWAGFGVASTSPAECGNGKCELGEEGWCSDCSMCGNGICEPGEEWWWCSDCPMCGNGICEPGEEGWCPDCQPMCGNGICEPGEEGWCSDCPPM
jgi:hypothetical protein